MKKRKRKTGLPPGTILYTGQKTDMPVQVNYLAYTVEQLTEEQFLEKTVVIHPSDTRILQWYDLRGLHKPEAIQALAKVYPIHPLALESVADIYKRPEFVVYPDGYFWSLKSVDFNSQTKTIEVQHVSIYFGEAYVLSFQEHEDDIFIPLRDRIRNASGRIRGRGSDYLCYAIVDLIVDRYYHALDRIQDELEEIEDVLSERPEQIDKQHLFHLRKQLIRFRRAVFPLREGLGQFARTESALVDESTLPYIRDVYDHVIQIAEQIDVLRDTLNGMQELYLSELSMRMNKVMQILTVITAIFVPISFLAGLYGMNFTYMPELSWRYGYFVLLSVMLVIVLLMMRYFRRQGWF